MLVPGALQALESLDLHEGGPGMDQDDNQESGCTRPLAEALSSGAAPSLRILAVASWYQTSDQDLRALAAMLETRGQNPVCRRLDRIIVPGLMALTTHASEAASSRKS